MGRNSTYNILMYSHDTYGLGHIRRTLAIASHLRGSHVNILILTGSPIAGRFTFPDQVDFVRVPGMIKQTNEEYLPLSIKINPRHAMDIRKNIITATAKTFQPHLFIVDKEPLGLRKEVLPTLQWLRRCMPRTVTVLGLRDIMDERGTVRRDWETKGVYDLLARLYSEIWVYGLREFYDPIREYAIPDEVSRKIHFTGYIPRKAPTESAVRKVKKEIGLRAGEKLVVVTTGGGGDGYDVINAYLSLLEAEPFPFAVRSMIVSGPFMPKAQRRKLFTRARKLGIRTYHFYRHLEKLMAAADLVIGMGGYNTACEILTQGTPALLIPRQTPRQEQLIRARILQDRSLVDYIPMSELKPAVLRRKILALLQDPEPMRRAMAAFDLTGIDVMKARIRVFRNAKS
jgi:predicted glycosyltransferase